MDLVVGAAIGFVGATLVRHHRAWHVLFRVDTAASGHDRAAVEDPGAP